MCVVSMVMDHQFDKWKKLVVEPVPNVYIPVTSTPPISEKEIQEFRELLERARKYDKEHNQPDCGIKDKKETLKKLAESLGVEINFVDD